MDCKGKIIVLKIGTASLTLDDGSLNQRVMVDVARQVEQLINIEGVKIILVSSGAVGTGKKYIGSFDGTLEKKKAAAAVGNPILLNKYKQFFSPYNIPIAQVLCERNHFSDSYRFEQLKTTINTLWDNGILPIANENDVIRNIEMNFSDNDELATLLAVGFNADVILFGTVVEGVYNENNAVIQEISNFTKETLGLANDDFSNVGLGGMTSKLTYAHLATTLGIKSVIFGIKTVNSIFEALQGRHGTTCIAQDVSKDVRGQWLKSGYFLNGSVVVNDLGCKALEDGQILQKHHIDEIVLPFRKGEVFEIKDKTGRLVAVAKANCSEKNIDTSDILASTHQIILL